jgi:energy-coupling factor transporter ATP-binding protein EcfA2
LLLLLLVISADRRLSRPVVASSLADSTPVPLFCAASELKHFRTSHTTPYTLHLQDVIALRKQRSGGGNFVTGEVRLNGWPQEAASFRRCSGYVEQFDVQSPELTVRETVLFSSRLRLDPALVESEAQRNGLVDGILEEVELTSLADALVGNSEDGGGLSFGQRKRLSIAVELAASPSILFLDEPTSGLESRSARYVCCLVWFVPPRPCLCSF